MQDQSGPTEATFQRMVTEAEEAGQRALENDDLVAAETVYTQLLSVAPKNVAALNGLGLIALRGGNLDAAEKHLKTAVAIAAATAEPHKNLAACYLSQNRARRALRTLAKALAIDPTDVEAIYLRSLAHQELKDNVTAESDLRAILAIDPVHTAANYNLGCLEANRGNLDAALAHFEMCTLSPDVPASIWLNYAGTLLLQDRIDEALTAFERAAALEPENIAAQIGISTCERRRGNLEQALLAAERAQSLQPNDPSAQNAAGIVYRELGQFDEAEANFASALKTTPDHAPALSNLGMLQLLRGNFADGWPNYDARRSDPAYHSQWDGINRPEWHGEDLAGKALAVLSEQGFGDTIQFLRYVPALCDMADQVHLAVQPELRRLASCVDAPVHMLGEGTQTLRLDYKVLMLAVPQALGIDTPDKITGQPYLNLPDAPSAAADKAAALPGLRVGLNWAGARRHKEDFKRSMGPEEIAPILDVPDVSFVNLSIGDDAASPPDGLLDLSADIEDFLDTAQVLKTLDLVISVDTATVHLAGALGVPCWLMLPSVPDWRWGLEGDRTPWYDSVQLFRQSERGHWTDVIERITAALRERVGA